MLGTVHESERMLVGTSCTALSASPAVNARGRKIIRYRILFQGTEDKYSGNRIFPNLGSFRSCSKHRIYVEISQNNINSVSDGYIIVEPKEQASKHDVHKNDCRWFSFYPSLTTCLNFMMTSGL